MSHIKLATSQYPITSHQSWSAWEQHTLRWIVEAVKNKAQVLVFPEYGSIELVSLFGADVQQNLEQQIIEMDKIKNDFIQFFSKSAKDYQVAILAPSLPVLSEDKKNRVNRAYFFKPDGSYDYQEKQHMTRFEDEQWKVSAGERQLKTFDVFGVRFGVCICFDVEFPQDAHQLARQGVQVLLAPSCTETMAGLNRVHVGARARALENQYYVVVAQTVGTAQCSIAVDINTGRAAVYTTCDKGFPEDGILAEGETNKIQWIYAQIDTSLIEKVRTEGSVFNYKNMIKEK